TSESEPYVCLAALFRVTSPGKRNAPRRSRFGEHRLRSSRHTNSPWSQTYPLNPEAPWILKPTPIACFYEFLCRAVKFAHRRRFQEYVREKGREKSTLAYVYWAMWHRSGKGNV